MDLGINSPQFACENTPTPSKCFLPRTSCRDFLKARITQTLKIKSSVPQKNPLASCANQIILVLIDFSQKVLQVSLFKWLLTLRIYTLLTDTNHMV